MIPPPRRTEESGSPDASTPIRTDGGKPSVDSGTTPKPDAGSPEKDAGPGTCAPSCAVGAGCTKDTDCASKACGEDGKCATSAATDGKEDDGESDVDCGGASTDSAPKCALGKKCATNADCMNNACGVTGTCATSAASDGIEDDGESDVDCGGTTTDGAPKCANGKMCVANADCTSGACGIGNVCSVSGSTDGLQDFGESDVDCGGTTTDTAPLCATSQKCVNNTDCTSAVCGLGNVCAANGYTDGLKDFGESDVDCGGNTTDGAPPCADGLKCVKANDCGATSVCDLTNTCEQPTSSDGIKDGTETDVDCGGGAPTNAPACATGKTCGIGADCMSGGCNYLDKCADEISCTPQNGGDTCGPVGGSESCCKTITVAGLPVTAGNPATASIDKYNITAGRMRAFVTATGGDLRTYIANHTPTWWNASWTNYLPDELDDSAYDGPHCDAAGDHCGVYQELGPYVHAPGAMGANEGCYITGNGARSYRLPDAINTKFKDPQSYSQAVDDTKSMNCVTAYITAAFCAWDGGHLPTHQQIDYVWGTAKYPWGNPAGAAPNFGGNPVGYSVANDTDPEKGIVGGPLTYGALSWGAFQGAPTVLSSRAPPTATQIHDLLWANYNYNYWGGAGKAGTDYTIFIAPPGRFPLGNGPYGHADLAGNVFDALEINGTNDCWSRAGSWQGHGIPYTSAGCGVNVAATNKYWAMGGRCAR